MSESGTHFAAEPQLGRRPTMRELHEEMLLRKRAAETAPETRKDEEPELVAFKNAVTVAATATRTGELSIGQRLERKFGLGRDPKRRRELYRRLEACVLKVGAEAFDIINECVADAVGRNNPPHWFCRAVVARLRDRKLLQQSTGGDPTW